MSDVEDREVRLQRVAGTVDQLGERGSRQCVTTPGLQPLVGLSCRTLLGEPHETRVDPHDRMLTGVKALVHAGRVPNRTLAGLEVL
jgi:hypothetical protein